MNIEAKKRIGLVALLAAMFRSPQHVEDRAEILERKNMLLTNYNRAPIPLKFKNQRQKRKLNRQIQNFKK